MNAFKDFRGSDSRWGKAREIFKRIVTVILLWNNTGGEAVSSVSTKVSLCILFLIVLKHVPGGKAIIVGFGVLLAVREVDICKLTGI